MSDKCRIVKKNGKMLVSEYRGRPLIIFPTNPATMSGASEHERMNPKFPPHSGIIFCTLNPRQIRNTPFSAATVNYDCKLHTHVRSRCTHHFHPSRFGFSKRVRRQRRFFDFGILLVILHFFLLGYTCCSTMVPHVKSCLVMSYPALACVRMFFSLSTKG